MSRKSLLEKYDLDRRVEDFIEDYKKDLLKTPRYTDIGNFYKPRELRNVIESMAVFAELRYPKNILYLDMTEKIDETYDWKKFGDIYDYFTLGLSEEFHMGLCEAATNRIIERGGNRIGGRRAFSFAKELNLDLKTPLAYALTDTSDPYGVDFIREALKSFKDIDDVMEIIVPVGYFMAKANSEFGITEMTIGKIVSKDKRFLTEALTAPARA